jgi:hypothetical protein
MTIRALAKVSVLTIAVPILSSIPGCNVESVDSRPSVGIASAYYGHLSAADIHSALALFSPEFTRTAKLWPELLESLQTQFGVVVSTELQKASLAPNGGVPCYLLTYKVKRQSLGSREELFICRSESKSHWTIDGQELTRDDTSKSIVGGKIPKIVGINSP